MKKSISCLLLLVTGSAVGALPYPQSDTWPSCNVEVQHRLAVNTGVSDGDPLQAHISIRASVLQRDISTALEDRYLSESQAAQMWHRVDLIRRDSDSYRKGHKFLGAAELAAYDRELDDIAGQICRVVR